LKPAKVSWQNEHQLRFVLREGRKRQIRRMCELVGLKVTGLKRVRTGSVALGQAAGRAMAYPASRREVLIEETRTNGRQPLALEAEIDAFVQERDWAQFHTPKNLAMSVAIEAAEIMEHFQWSTGEESRELAPEKRDEVANEIGDVLIYLLRLARTLGHRSRAAATAKLAQNRRNTRSRRPKDARPSTSDLE
jgi:NTP pyrophosphatase (non-canonical NTP hydrolase)